MQGLKTAVTRQTEREAIGEAVILALGQVSCPEEMGKDLAVDHFWKVQKGQAAVMFNCVVNSTT